jgi:hypothetical protein
MKANTLRLAMTVAIAFAAAAEAVAQQASSFEQLQVLVKIGDTVTLIDSTGQESKGKIADLTPSSLRFLVNGVTRDLTQKDVLEIRQRRGDSLKNGATIGALVGLGLGILGAVALCTDGEYESCPAVAAASIGLYTGMGAASGVGIDALIVGDRAVYRPRQTTARYNVKPYVTSRQRGVRLSFTF